jgi:hypothetical protein
MKLPSRKTLEVALMLALLAGAAAWGLGWMLDRRQAAGDAGDDLATCQRLASEIGSVRQKPTVVAGSAGVRELGEQIQAASRQANLGPDAIQGVFPQPSRRVGESVYVHKPTALALRSISLPQLAVFLYNLSSQPGLTVSDLRLRSPHGASADSAWDADVTVTYLVYAPPARAQPDL